MEHSRRHGGLSGDMKDMEDIDGVLRFGADKSRQDSWPLRRVGTLRQCLQDEGGAAEP